ncbi:MAG: hypothetical protein AAFO15_01705 [Pseudomonadota bacterium]
MAFGDFKDRSRQGSHSKIYDAENYFRNSFNKIDEYVNPDSSNWESILSNRGNDSLSIIKFPVSDMPIEEDLSEHIKKTNANILLVGFNTHDPARMKTNDLFNNPDIAEFRVIKGGKMQTYDMNRLLNGSEFYFEDLSSRRIGVDFRYPSQGWVNKINYLLWVLFAPSQQGISQFHSSMLGRFQADNLLQFMRGDNINYDNGLQRVGSYSVPSLKGFFNHLEEFDRNWHEDNLEDVELYDTDGIQLRGSRLEGGGIPQGLEQLANMPIIRQAEEGEEEPEGGPDPENPPQPQPTPGPENPPQPQPQPEPDPNNPPQPQPQPALADDGLGGNPGGTGGDGGNRGGGGPNTGTLTGSGGTGTETTGGDGNGHTGEERGGEGSPQNTGPGGGGNPGGPGQGGNTGGNGGHQGGDGGAGGPGGTGTETTGGAGIPADPNVVPNNQNHVILEEESELNEAGTLPTHQPSVLENTQNLDGSENQDFNNGNMLYIDNTDNMFNHILSLNQPLQHPAPQHVLLRLRHIIGQLNGNDNVHNSIRAGMDNRQAIEILNTIRGNLLNIQQELDEYLNDIANNVRQQRENTENADNILQHVNNLRDCLFAEVQEGRDDGDGIFASVRGNDIRLQNNLIDAIDQVIENHGDGGNGQSIYQSIRGGDNNISVSIREQGQNLGMFLANISTHLDVVMGHQGINNPYNNELEAIGGDNVADDLGMNVDISANMQDNADQNEEKEIDGSNDDNEQGNSFNNSNN